MPKYSSWVIKLGGSLIGSPDLDAWLAAIAEISRRTRVVIVPGGGEFADVVRRTQSDLKIDDTVAHHMALQGMRQFGLALAARIEPWCSAYLTCTPAINACSAKCGVCIWDPCDPYLDGASLPKDWGVTSDSLSLWLCGELHDSRLILVKSTTPRSLPSDLVDLAASNFIDPYFPTLRVAIDRPGWWVQSAHADALASVVAGCPPRAQYIGEI